MNILFNHSIMYIIVYTTQNVFFSYIYSDEINCYTVFNI